MELNRRAFLKGAVLTGAAAAAAGLVGCSPSTGNDASTGGAAVDNSRFAGIIDSDDYAASLAEIDPITTFDTEESYDIVVAGAGCAGTLAVLTALDEGASVCCLQKLSAASANGHYSSGLILSESDPVGVLEWIQTQRKSNNFRVNWQLLNYHAQTSGETLCFLDKKSSEAGFPAVIKTIADSTVYADGTYIMFAKHLWRSNDQLVKKMCEYAEGQGAKFYYSTPAVQLVKDGSGAVTGIIGKTSDGKYIKLNANKAVILATGDYECNDSMKAKFLPDTLHFETYQLERTGDGQLMAILAGGQMVPQPHTKGIHDVFSTTFGVSATPLMSLDHHGKRFMNEETTMPLWNDATRYFYDQEDRGTFFRFFDDAYDKKFTTFPAREEMEKYIVGQEISMEDTMQIPYEPGMIGCYRADTLDELATKIGLEPQALKTSVDRWNDMCAKGRDEDFGLLPNFLKPIDTPPYWGITNHVRIMSIFAGVVVDEFRRVLDEDYKPILGLYAAGLAGGDTSGAADWQMGSGVANGHCMTSGRYTVLHALNGSLTPTHPVTWAEVKGDYDETVLDSTWQKPGAREVTQ